MAFKTQDLLLLGLIGGGIWWLNQGKKKGVQAKKSSGGGGGGGLSSGSLDTSSTAIQPASETSIDVNITQDENTPSQMDCIKNPTLFGCESVLPTLASADEPSREIATSEISMGQGGMEGTVLGMGDGSSTGGDPRSPEGHGTSGLGEHTDTTTDVHGDVVSTTTDYKPAKNYYGSTKTKGKGAPPVKARFDGYSREEVSEERTRGRKDKYDFDGEYGTFNDDSF